MRSKNKMGRMNYILLVLCGLGLSIDGLAQNRQIITHQDSVCEFGLISIIDDEEKKLDAKKYYHWYRWGAIYTTQGGYSGRLLDGSYSVFYASKQLKVQGEMKLGLRDGEWLFWNIQGNLKKVEHWKKGKRTKVVYPNFKKTQKSKNRIVKWWTAKRKKKQGENDKLEPEPKENDHAKEKKKWNWKFWRSWFNKQESPKEKG
jgi:hypothetical protein